jgi:chaperonin cofactor prefoldin
MKEFAIIRKHWKVLFFGGIVITGIILVYGLLQPKTNDITAILDVPNAWTTGSDVLIRNETLNKFGNYPEITRLRADIFEEFEELLPEDARTGSKVFIKITTTNTDKILNDLNNLPQEFQNKEQFNIKSAEGAAKTEERIKTLKMLLTEAYNAKQKVDTAPQTYGQYYNYGAILTSIWDLEKELAERELDKEKEVALRWEVPPNIVEYNSGWQWYHYFVFGLIISYVFIPAILVSFNLLLKENA